MERRHLLSLPPEILQIIMRFMDPGTFYISLLVCKEFYTAALNSRRNIVRHLNNLPGSRPLTDQSSTRELFSFFLDRASQSLCMAGVLANVKSYIPTYNPSEPEPPLNWLARNAKTSRIKSPGRGRTPNYRMNEAVFSLDPTRSPHLLARVDENQVVNIYLLTDEHISLQAQLWHLLPGAFDKPDLVVIKMAFAPNQDLAVLYKPRAMAKGNDEDSFFSLKLPPPAATLKLVTYACEPMPGHGYSYSLASQETRDIRLVTANPVSLAMGSDGSACISWDNLDEDRTEMWFIDRNPKEMERTQYDSDPKIQIMQSLLPDSGPHMRDKRLISKIEYIDKGLALNFFELGFPVHKWFARTDPVDIISGILPNAFGIQIAPEHDPERFVIGMPFWGCHVRGNVCISCFLAIGVSTTDDENNTYIVHGVGVLRQGNQCNHEIDLQIGIKCGHWKAVAFLAGLKQSNSSLGIVMAISPGGSRIAAASWDCVLIWTFDPFLLHLNSVRHDRGYFPIRDYNPTKKIGRLRPIKLPSRGVVYGMRWTSERVLFATTDHGIIQWDMRCTSMGQHEDLSLDSSVCNGPIGA